MKILCKIQYCLYFPDDALVVRNIYTESFFVLYCETYAKYIPRKVLLLLLKGYFPNVRGFPTKLECSINAQAAPKKSFIFIYLFI